MTADPLDLAHPEQLTLRSSVDALSTGYLDPETENAITRVLTEAEQKVTDASGALGQLQAVLEAIRKKPEGAERITLMNTFVRTLGRADRLAVYLDILRRSLSAADPTESEIAERSRSARMHCIYGWGGQTGILTSLAHPTPATTPPGSGVGEYFAYPVAEWHLSIHIWQPNPGAQGFASTKRLEPGAIVEPPHSHPFSFVSYVSIGEMRQSIYAEDPHANSQSTVGERYHDVDLQGVDSVWPPHQEYQPSRLRTVEDRLHLRAGQSYYMPTHLIHDVEVEREIAAHSPAITLFLCSETTQIPKAFLVSDMADFHRRHPEVIDDATALDPEEWSAKLAATARYLRGEADHLRLSEIFDCTSTYGFMNV
ncbi:hypothetical protein [Nonomuraea sp. NPDC050643]|uniref:hypothetical protein n=1 Tax=Nonomuraea sp. NPDC050643 TaxID=3155660 RepID=UPI0033D54832